MHLVKVCRSAINLPPKLSEHQRLSEQLVADVYMAIDPASRKVNSPLIISVFQPAIWPQVYGGKVDAWGLMVPQEVAALVHGVIWVVGQQVCRDRSCTVSHNRL